MHISTEKPGIDPTPQPQYYIHIGTHKTGSTAIQHFMYRNYAALLQRGVLYPKVGLHDAGHHSIAWSIKQNKKALTEKIFEEINGIAQKNNIKKIILSSEEFEFIRDPGLLKRALPQNAQIIAYLRRPDSYLESEYNQHVKMPGIRFSGDIFRFYFFHDFTQRFNYRYLFGIWREVADDENAIQLISYDKCRKDGTLFSSFMTALGEPLLPEYSLPSEAESNVSLPGAGICYLARMNNTQMTAVQHACALQIVSAHFANSPKRSLLTPHDRIRLVNRFRPSYQFLERKFNIELFTDPATDPQQQYPALRYWEDVNPSLLEQFLRESLVIKQTTVPTLNHI